MTIYRRLDAKARLRLPLPLETVRAQRLYLSPAGLDYRPVVMTPAQQRRQDLSCEALQRAIDAQNRPPEHDGQ